jgi:hypothetical protein
VTGLSLREPHGEEFHMKLVMRICSVMVVAAASVSLAASSTMGDPETLLARVRAAIGGAVAQQTVTSLELRGTHIRNVAGRTIESDWRASWEAPDKFVQVVTQSIGVGSMGMTRRYGFNGRSGINQTTSDLPMPAMPPSNPDGLVPYFKQDLANLLVPLLASVAPLAEAFPHSAVAADTNTVTFHSADASPLQLSLDPDTSLPSLVTWMAFPVMTVSSTTTMMTTRDGRPAPGQPMTAPMPPMPAGPPSKVEHQMTLSDYRTDKGVTWPRRLTISVGGTTTEEYRIGGWTINPTINPRTFAVVK